MTSDEDVKARTALRNDAGITLTILGLALFFIVKSLPLLNVKSSASDPGAGFWPLAALTTMAIFASLNLISLYLQLQEDSGSDDQGGSISEKALVETPQNDNRKPFILVIGLLLFYAGIIQYVGFLIATPLFLVGLGRALGYRDQVKLVMFGVIVSVVLQTTFGEIFNIVLPRGTGIFREISLIFEGLL